MLGATLLTPKRRVDRVGNAKNCHASRPKERARLRERPPLRWGPRRSSGPTPWACPHHHPARNRSLPLLKRPAATASQPATGDSPSAADDRMLRPFDPLLLGAASNRSGRTTHPSGAQERSRTRRSSPSLPYYIVHPTAFLLGRRAPSSSRATTQRPFLPWARNQCLGFQVFWGKKSQSK